MRCPCRFRRTSSLLIAAITGLQVQAGGCGVTQTDKGLNAPCTRTKDCDEGLVCLDGVCQMPDASVDGGELAFR